MNNLYFDYQVQPLQPVTLSRKTTTTEVPSLPSNFLPPQIHHPSNDYNKSNAPFGAPVVALLKTSMEEFIEGNDQSCKASLTVKNKKNSRPNSMVTIPDSVLNDLCCRFIHTCPPEDMSLQRFCFQVEKAHWFYLDVFRKRSPNLPLLKVKSFTLLMFQHSPLLKQLQMSTYWESWREYVRKIPIAGGFLLNRKRDKVLMVKECESGVWGFPQGKLNQNEREIDCALREIEEEVGYDPLQQKAEWSETPASSFKLAAKSFTFFAFYNVDESFSFKPQCEQEIDEICWRPISDLRQLYSKGNINPFLQ